MNHYLVDTQTEAIQAIRLLSDSSKGRANFFVLEALKSVPKRGEINLNSDKLIPALNIIDVDVKYRPLCEMLLNNVFLLQSGEDEELATALPAEHVIILGSSGKFSKSRTGMSGGSIGLFEGKRIGRAKNLENLAKEIKKLESQMTNLKTAIGTESDRLVALRNSTRKPEIEAAAGEIRQLNNELISVKTKSEQYLAFIESSETRKSDIENKMHAIAEELLAAEPAIATLKQQQTEKGHLLLEKQEAYNELADLVNEKVTAYNQNNISFHQQQNKVAGIEKDLEYRSSQESNLNSRIQAASTGLAQTLEDIKNTLQHADLSDEALIAMYQQKEELEKGVQEAEQAYYSLRGLITTCEEQVGALRKKKELADILSNEIKDQKNNLKIELNALKERLSIEFSIDISDLLDEAEPEGENEDDLKAATERMKRQLDDFGTINPLAMEAYQEMNDRYKFILEQKKDLLDAKTSLLETIKEIDDTARLKFMEAFNKVRENFIHVFRSLFNDEDSCDLTLSDPSNPLESDIDIIARPKGKRPLSINQLSGGEKTLTATALLFSLYLLKPAPFCIFDEVDAPLDDTNIDKFNNIIRKFSSESQFIIVSHNKRTIASTDIIYGVTMIEQGVSRVVAVDMREIAA